MVFSQSYFMHRRDRQRSTSIVSRVCSEAVRSLVKNWQRLPDYFKNLRVGRKTGGPGRRSPTKRGSAIATERSPSFHGRLGPMRIFLSRHSTWFSPDGQVEKPSCQVMAYEDLSRNFSRV